jgi:hypothetical protein
VEVAVNLTVPLLSPSGSRAFPLRPDLTPPLLDLGNAVAHRRRRQSLELAVTSSTPLRAPPFLHACLLVAPHLLNSSATKPAAADRRSTLGEQPLAQTLAQHRARACMRRHARKKARAPSDLNRTAAYRFGRARPGQAGGSGPAWLASAAPAHSLFFSNVIFPFLQIPTRFKNG